MAMVASAVHTPKPPLPIDRTVDGSVTAERSEHQQNAYSPMDPQPHPIVTVLDAPTSERLARRRRCSHTRLSRS
jgi:hypothetical protein